MASCRFPRPVGWLAMMIIVLPACTPADRVPLSGGITLEYVSTSHSGDVVVFTLANGAPRPIYFLGNPAPREARMTCSTPGEALAFIQGIADPPGREENIAVAPGERQRLDLYVVAFPPDFKSRYPRCRLGLTLEDGMVVESIEFSLY